MKHQTPLKVTLIEKIIIFGAVAYFAGRILISVLFNK